MSQKKDSSLPPDVSSLSILALDHLIESSDPRFDYCPWWTNRDRSRDDSYNEEDASQEDTDIEEDTSEENFDLDDDHQPQFVEYIFNDIVEVCFKALNGSSKV